MRSTSSWQAPRRNESEDPVDHSQKGRTPLRWSSAGTATVVIATVLAVGAFVAMVLQHTSVKIAAPVAVFVFFGLLIAVRSASQILGGDRVSHAGVTPSGGEVTLEDNAKEGLETTEDLEARLRATDDSQKKLVEALGVATAKAQQLEEENRRLQRDS